MQHSRNRRRQLRLSNVIKEACKENPGAAKKLETIPCFDGVSPPTPAIQNVWGLSIIPRLFPVTSCFKDSCPPTDHELWAAALRKIDLSSEVIAGAYDRNGNWQTAECVINLLICHDNWKITVPDMDIEVIDDKMLDLPFANICNKSAIVKFHIDETGGLSGLVGTCQKVWIFTPHTDHNLEVFKLQHATSSADWLSDAIARMEHVIFVRQTREYVLFVPYGEFHATVTEDAGMLYWVAFEILDDLHMMAPSLDGFLLSSSATEKVTAIARLNKVLKRAIQEASSALELVATICDVVVQRTIVQYGALFKETRAILKRFLRGPKSTVPLTCSCGHVSEDNKAAMAHVYTVHFERLSAQ